MFVSIWSLDKLTLVGKSQEVLSSKKWTLFILTVRKNPLHLPPPPPHHTGYPPHPRNHLLSTHNCLVHYCTADEQRRCDIWGRIVFSEVESEVLEFHFQKIHSPVLQATQKPQNKLCHFNEVVLCCNFLLNLQHQLTYLPVQSSSYG